MVSLLASDAQWWITPTVGVLGSPTIGRDAIRDSMAVIFGQMYTDVRTDVHHTLAEGDTGAARFTMYATRFSPTASLMRMSTASGYRLSTTA